MCKNYLWPAVKSSYLNSLGGKKNLLLAERAVGRFLKAEACFFMSQGKTLLVLVWL